MEARQRALVLEVGPLQRLLALQLAELLLVAVVEREAVLGLLRLLVPLRAGGLGERACDHLVMLID